MPVDADRRALVQEALRQSDLDALVCGLPANVLLLSSYWPVTGTSLAIAVRDGPIALLVPEDEKELADHGGADEVHTYKPAPLDNLGPLLEMQAPPLSAVARKLSLQHKRIGHEHGGWYEASSYAAMHLYQASLAALIERAFDQPRLSAADEQLMRLRSRKTPQELERLRLACRIVGEAFDQGRRRLDVGLKETEAAALFRAPLSVEGVGRDGVERAGGFTFCMSGPNSANASGAFARSRARRLAEHDLILIHCNSYVDGYWTDITRTYCLGEGDSRQRKLYDAVSAAGRAAREAIRPGARAADVDKAAREVLAQHGFGKAFKHSTGHGVGFSAINHLARPRLHPRSPDVLETGMVFNVEPAIYLEGYGGLRHCDMVALTPSGVEELTPFQRIPSEK
jgi:Xaa-Pro aminopeptidase